MQSPLDIYLKALAKEHQTGRAGEHSYRPALKALFESLGKGIEALNEPNRVACGAPDFQVFTGKRDARLTVGYIETKDIDVSLVEAERSEQLKRYRAGFENLLLTDYLSFRWYVDGDLRETAAMGKLTNKRVKADADGLDGVLALLNNFLEHQPQPIGKANDLAVRMANLTREIKTIIAKSFEDKKPRMVLSRYIHHSKPNLYLRLMKPASATCSHKPSPMGSLPPVCNTMGEPPGYGRAGRVRILK